MIQYVESASPEENAQTMESAMHMVKSGQITYAVRDTSIDGREIHQGDLMGLDDNGIEAVMPNVKECLFELLDNMIDDDSEFVSLYYGSNVTKEEAEQLLEQLSERYLRVEIECNYGGQPIYYYIISVE